MWGNNFFGQIGNGSIEDVTTPTEINVDGGEEGIQGTITNFKIGIYTTAVVINDGITDHLYMWGNNFEQQIGNGFINKYLTLPVEINVDGGAAGIQGEITNLELGNFFTSVIIENNGIKNIYSWGENLRGQIGNSNEAIDQVENATIINPDGGAAGIQGSVIAYQASKDFSMLATKTSDEKQHLFSWGGNANHQLGDISFNGDFTATPKEINIDGGNAGIQGQIQTLALGSNHAGLVIKKNNEQYLYMWGGNDKGQIGNDKISNYEDPQIISIPGTKENIDGTVEHLSLGEGNSQIFVKNNEGNTRIFAWGDNKEGAFGNGTTNSSLTPIEIKPVSGQIGIEGTVKYSNLTRYDSMITINDGYKDHFYISGSNRNNIISQSDQEIFLNYQQINSFIKTEPTLKVKVKKETQNSVIIEYVLKQNDATQLTSLKLSGNQVSPTDELDLLAAGYGWGENKVQIDNLSSDQTYQDWSLSYETDLNAETITIDSFQPTFKIKTWMWIMPIIVIILIGLVIFFIIYKIRERRMLKRILKKENEQQ